MLHHRQNNFAVSFWLAGVLVILMSFGAGWGKAYGQTSGPTPTPANAAVLAATKNVDKQTVGRGETVFFTVRVQNTSALPAGNVVVQDDMPDTFEVVNATTTMGSVQTAAQRVTATIPELGPTVTVLVVIEAKVRNNAQGMVTNTAQIRYNTVAGLGAALADQEIQAQVGLNVVAGGAAGNGAAGNGAAGNGAAGDGAAGNGAAGNGAADQDGQALGSQLSATGAESAMQWPLFLLGITFLATGGLIFTRVRKSS